MNMKINTYITETNSGILTKTEQIITIKKNRWVDKDGTSHPMKFSQPIAFENKNVYFLYTFGQDKNKDGTPSQHGKHISLTFWENQKFLWIQNKHWFQKEENLRYVINILFLIGGLALGVLNYFK